jgi:RNA polymerase sigma factor (sigma-70 family)
LSTDTTNISREEILRHEPYVRSLAARLVVDPNLAADIAQNAWLRALSSPPRHAESLRGWFRRVVHTSAASLLGSEAARARREAQVEPPGEAPSSIEEHGVEQLNQILLEELDRLEEPYRRTLTLRFLEDRSNQEVASLLFEPVATVRTRVRRGLERLRERLDRRYGGDRDHWSHAMIGLALQGGAMPKAASLALPLVLLTSILAVVGAWVWITADQPGEPVQPASIATQVADGSSSPRAEAASRVGEPVRQPAVAAPAPEVVSGLSLEARWADGGGPIAGLGINVQGVDAAFEVTCDGRGLASLDVPPGSWRVTPTSGRTRWARVEPGARTDLTFLIPRGRELRGAVLKPKGQPLRGAVVRAGPREAPGTWTHATEVDAQGRFVLHGVPEDAWVMASFENRTELVMLDQPTLEGRDEIVFRPRRYKGMIRGRVTDPSGAPIAGASLESVQVDLLRPSTGDRGMNRGMISTDPCARSVRTGPDGEFEIHNVVSGTHRLVVRAEDYVSRAMTVGLRRHEIELVPEARLSGALEWADGSPAVGAHVRLRDEFGGWRTVVCDGEGRFVLGGLVAGSIDLRADAEDGARIGRSSWTVSVTAGQESSWMGTLQESDGLVGRLQGAQGAALAGWRVELIATGQLRGGQSQLLAPIVAEVLALQVTDREGRFRFADAHEPQYRLRAYSPDHPVIARADLVVSPSSSDLRVDVPALPEHPLRGEVRLADGAVPPGGRAVLSGDVLDVPLICRLDPDEGTFLAPRLPAGRYELTVWWADHLPVSVGTVEVAHGQDNQLALVVVPGDATLRATAQLEDRRAVRVVLCQGRTRVLALSVGADHDQLEMGDDGRLRITGISPGTYFVSVLVAREPMVARELTLSPGEELDLGNLPELVERDLIIWLAEPPDQVMTLDVSVETLDGWGMKRELVLVGPGQHGPFTVKHHLPSGLFDVRAALTAGPGGAADQSGSWSLEGGAGGAADPIELRLERVDDVLVR